MRPSPHTQEGVLSTQQNVGQILVSDAIKDVFGVIGADVVPSGSQSPVSKEHGMEYPDSEQPLGEVFAGITDTAREIKRLTVGEKIGTGSASAFEDIWETRAENLSDKPQDKGEEK